MLTYATFIANFPEFSGSSYPEGWFNYWLSFGTKLLRPCVWTDFLDDGMSLFIAHNLVLQLRAVKAAATGGDAGGNTGPLSSKSVDKVSMGYDTGAASLEGAGAYNLTTYGTRFYQLMKMVGAGGAIAAGSGEIVAPALAQWQDGLPRWP